MSDGDVAEPGGRVGGYSPDTNEGDRKMGDLLKGGILWLLGVPLVLVIVLFVTGIL